MSIKFYTLAVGLTATLIFGAGNIQAQSGAMPAEIHVARDANILSISSNILNIPSAVCRFTNRIVTFGTADQFPPIEFLGAVQADGSLTVDRQLLLRALNRREAVLVFWETDCGSNWADFGAKAFRARIRLLQDLDTVTVHTLYFPYP